MLIRRKWKPSFRAATSGPTRRFVLAKPAASDKETHVWTPLHFQTTRPKIGEPVYSVGLLPKTSGYRSYFTSSVVSAELRDAIKQTLVAGGSLSSPGSPVFDAQGNAVGVVTYQMPTSVFLDNVDERQAMITTLWTYKLFTPASEFILGINDPPTVGHPVPLAYTGIVDLSGLEQDIAEVFNLKDQTAVQVGGVLPRFPGGKKPASRRRTSSRRSTANRSAAVMIRARCP